MSVELHEACKEEDVGTVQACLARGVNVNAKHDGVTPLITAVKHNNIKIVRILLARDDLDIAAADVGGGTALHFACYLGHAECVALIGQDSRMNSRIINIKNNAGNTALVYAVMQNNIEIVRILLARDDLNIAATNAAGRTALHNACYKGHAECVALLGKDRNMNSRIINTKTNGGVTALMVAVEENYLPCVERMAELDGVDWETGNMKEESLEDVAR